MLSPCLKSWLNVGPLALQMLFSHRKDIIRNVDSQTNPQQLLHSLHARSTTEIIYICLASQCTNSSLSRISSSQSLYEQVSHVTLLILEMRRSNTIKDTIMIKNETEGTSHESSGIPQVYCLSSFFSLTLCFSCSVGKPPKSFLRERVRQVSR